MGAKDRNGQDNRMGASRTKHTEGGHGGAGSSGGHGRGSSWPWSTCIRSIRSPPGLSSGTGSPTGLVSRFMGSLSHPRSVLWVCVRMCEQVSVGV